MLLRKNCIKFLFFIFPALLAIAISVSACGKKDSGTTTDNPLPTNFGTDAT